MLFRTFVPCVFAGRLYAFDQLKMDATYVGRRLSRKGLKILEEHKINTNGWVILEDKISVLWSTKALIPQKSCLRYYNRRTCFTHLVQ